MKFGVIFDWDGVILDSSGFHAMSWEILAEERGLPLPEGHFEKGFGLRNETIIPKILKWASEPEEVAELAFAKEEAYRSLIRKNGIEPLPGVKFLLKSLENGGHRFAVGSSTPKENLICAMELLGYQDTFQAILSGDDVTQGKPNPEVFLKAAKAIHCEPSNCVVFEDALPGIEAAKAGGMKVVGVATTNSLEEIAHADLAVESLEEITLDRLQALFG